MRYIDSGIRDAAQAVANWLLDQLNDQSSELRIQSGFYSQNALVPFLDRFKLLVDSGGIIRIVVGSNDGQTLAPHLGALCEALQIPRDHSDLGVVYLAGAFYHPKTFHIVRKDGSQTAYVGSANFTLPGIAAKHIEAGVLFDTREGDSHELLTEIGSSTDAWFSGDRQGIEIIRSLDDIDNLLETGVVRAELPPRPAKPKDAEGKVPTRPTLKFLVDFPPAALEQGQAAEAAQPDLAEQVDGPVVGLPIEQRTPPYPPYMYFAPDAEQATIGAEALTGSGLGNANGLIVRLSRDNDRHWRQAPGTANLSIPISVASTFRFGIYGPRSRPRAEFDIAIRYVSDGLSLVADPAPTGLMSFGYTPEDTGHPDLRLVIPKAPIAALRPQLVQRGLELPKANDLAVLEWPTLGDPTFRMTVCDQSSALGVAINDLWRVAVENGNLVSRGACWLPGGVSPQW